MKIGLEKFYDNINLADNIYYHLDERGNFNILTLPKDKENLAVLLVGCQYLELTDEELNKFVFEMKIEKDKKFKKIKINRPVPKSVITGNDKDKFTLINQETKVNQVWLVSNTFRLTKSFDNKKEALEFCQKINSRFI